MKAISDNYPKTVITLDRYTLGNYEGIQVVNAIDWLLDALSLVSTSNITPVTM